MAKQIRGIEGPLTGERFTLAARFVIGRGAEADLQVIAKGVSRLHACLTIEDPDLFIADLGSSNGTFIGAQRVDGKQPLALGDKFRVGDAVFEVIEGDGAGVDDDFDLKLASGPAESETAIAFIEVPRTIGCGDPLHAQAIRDRWRHCPQCGAAIDV